MKLTCVTYPEFSVVGGGISAIPEDEIAQSIPEAW